MDEPLHIQAGLTMLSHGRYIDTEKAWWTKPDPLTPPFDAVYGLAAKLLGKSPDFRSSPFLSFDSVSDARWINCVLGLMILLTVMEWSDRLWGGYAGLFAALALASEPLFIGHSGIVSTDLAGAAGGLIAAHSLWRGWFRTRALADWRWRFWKVALWCGVAVGFAVACKISNLVFVGIAPVATVWGAWRWRRIGGGRWLARGLAAGTMTALVGLAVASAAYGWMDLYDKEPLMVFGHSFTLPVGHELAYCALWAAGLRGKIGATVFYKGWFQDPSPKHDLAAFIYKTPLPLLALLAIGAVVALALSRGRRRQGALWVALAGGGLAAWFSTRGVYLGLRHMLLPIVLLCVLAGRLGVVPLRGRWRAARWGGFLVCCGLLVASMTIVARRSPWFLSYFNELAGDRLILVDSDMDWGQGLIALEEWERRNSPDRPIWLSYFGNNRPEDYGVRYRGMLSPFSPGVRLDPEWEQANDPAKVDGWVAISATQLAGRYMWDAGKTGDYYAAYRALTPAARIAGGSIWIYDCRKAAAGGAF